MSDPNVPGVPPAPVLTNAAPTLGDTVRRLALGTQSGIERYSRHLLSTVRGDPEHPPAAPLDLSRLLASPLGVAALGHATVLLRINGRTILTDPVFSHRIGMTVAGTTFGLARLAPPAVDVERLPRIDAVLISHAHFDHLDRPSLARLAAGPARGATVITALNTRRLIPEGFGQIVELPWGADHADIGLSVRALKPQHWGARAAIDHHRRFNAYVLESDHGGGRRVFFAGDTGDTHAFDRVGPVDLSIFGIGAYDPWEQAHATPEQVWRMFLRQCDAGEGARCDQRLPRLLPMHHSTFELGREPIDEPLRRLRAIAGESGRLVAETPGSLWVMPEQARPDPAANDGDAGARDQPRT